MGLTDARIRALKPRNKRYLVSDGSGLSLDVLPSGKMSWFFRYRLGGKQEKVTLGAYPDMTLKAARIARAEHAVLVASGKSPALEKKLTRAGLTSNPTVREFGDRYYREQVQPRWKDPSDVRRYLENDIFAAFGNRLLKEITALDVQALVYRKRNDGKVQAALKILGTVRRMFDYAVELQLVAINPAARLAARFVGRAAQRNRVLAPAEVRVYLKTVYGSNINRRYKLAIHILLLTMVRKSELLLARWEHVNFETSEWGVPTEHSKTGKPHVIYMSSQVAEMFGELKALSCGSALVLPGRDGPNRTLARSTIGHAVGGLTFPGLEPMTVHDLRRTASTLLHEKGFSSDVIEKALNHTIGGVRGIYNKAEHSAERKRMLQWWADYVDGIVNESKVIVGSFAAGA
jgi:integrase